MSAKTCLATTAAVLALAFAVQTASANRISISEKGFRTVWAPLEGEAASATIRCPVTLEGSLHTATITKTNGALVGHTTRGSVNGALAAGACTGGAMTIYQESFPWHMTYASFSGTLPRPTSFKIAIINARLRIDPLGILPACNVRTTSTFPAKLDMNVESNGLVTGLTAESAAEIPLEGEAFCTFGGSGHLSGTARISRLGTTANMCFRLI